MNAPNANGDPGRLKAAGRGGDHDGADGEQAAAALRRPEVPVLRRVVEPAPERRHDRLLAARRTRSGRRGRSGAVQGRPRSAATASTTVGNSGTASAAQPCSWTARPAPSTIAGSNCVPAQRCSSSSAVLGRPGAAVGPGRRHRVERVGHRDDPGELGDLVAPPGPSGSRGRRGARGGAGCPSNASSRNSMSRTISRPRTGCSWIVGELLVGQAARSSAARASARRACRRRAACRRSATS